MIGDTRAIGLDVGARLVKAAQVARRGSSLRVERCVQFSRLDIGGEINEAEASRIVAVLLRRGFQGVPVVIAAPDEIVQTETIDLPSKGSGAPVEQIARMELARMHNREPDAFEFAMWDLPATARSSTGCAAMAVACAHTGSEALLDAFDQAGLEIARIDFASRATAAACGLLDARRSGLRVLIDLGYGAARLTCTFAGVIVHERSHTDLGVGALIGRVEEERGVDRDVGEAMLEALTPPFDGDRRADPDADLRKLTGAFADQLLGEIERAVGYATRRYEDADTQEIVLVGGGAGFQWLPGTLARRTETPLTVARPSSLTACATAGLNASDSPALVSAVGLMSKGGAS